VLGDRIAAQVERLYAETGRPVDLVAESEGTLGVYAMLARHPDVPIGSVVLLSPIIAPGQVSYPADDRDARGNVPGYLLQAVVWFIGGLSPFGTSGAGKLINSVDQTGASYVQAAVRDFLAGHAVSAESPLQEAAEAVAQAAAAWRMPQLVTPTPPCSGSSS
jgi:pimeloyl-ACP methyl ester carboxylesterase